MSDYGYDVYDSVEIVECPECGQSSLYEIQDEDFVCPHLGCDFFDNKGNVHKQLSEGVDYEQGDK